MRSLAILASSLSIGLAWKGASNTSTLHASGFESDTVNPFSACNYKSPSYSERTSGSPTYSGTYKWTVFKDETDYDGTRDDKGAEFCVFVPGTSTNLVNMHKEGWQGFSIYVPSTLYPTNRSAIVAQQFCPGGCSSWCGTISIVNNTLCLDRRAACGDSVHEVIVDDITRDVWHTVVVHARVSNSSDGAYEVWYDQQQLYSAKSINFGFGDGWTDNTLDNGFYFKNGMYAYDIEDYQSGHNRTLYFDNVSWYSVDDGQTDGYSVVSP